MPEGDALHRIAARLQPLVGERVRAESPHPRGQATGVARVGDGRVLEHVEAVGKHLLLRFDGGVVLRSHLRMSGRWRLDRHGAPRRGLPWLVLRGQEWEATQWNGPVLALDERPVRRLGHDLLAAGIIVEDVLRVLRRSDPSRLIGEALLDQRVVAGIGNMWLAEALWPAYRRGDASPMSRTGSCSRRWAGHRRGCVPRPQGSARPRRYTAGQAGLAVGVGRRSPPEASVRRTGRPTGALRVSRRDRSLPRRGRRRRSADSSARSRRRRRRCA
jgi:endonuclease VIII